MFYSALEKEFRAFAHVFFCEGGHVFVEIFDVVLVVGACVHECSTAREEAEEEVELGWFFGAFAERCTEGGKERGCNAHHHVAADQRLHMKVRDEREQRLLSTDIAQGKVVPRFGRFRIVFGALVAGAGIGAHIVITLVDVQILARVIIKGKHLTNLLLTFFNKFTPERGNLQCFFCYLKAFSSSCLTILDFFGGAPCGFLRDSEGVELLAEIHAEAGVEGGEGGHLDDLLVEA